MSMSAVSEGLGRGQIGGLSGGGGRGGSGRWGTLCRWKQGLGEGMTGRGVKEGRVALACLAWTSEVGTLHCLFNREQISKKIEAHQSLELGWVRLGGDCSQYKGNF